LRTQNSIALEHGCCLINAVKICQQALYLRCGQDIFADAEAVLLDFQLNIRATDHVAILKPTRPHKAHKKHGRLRMQVPVRVADGCTTA